MIREHLRLLLLCALLLTALRPAGAQAPAAPAPTPLMFRWVWCMHYLNNDQNTADLQALMGRAKKAGYNGIVLADYGLSVLDHLSSHYFQNLAAVKKTADELGLGLYPTVCQMGYSNGLLSYDPNLAEGLPVRDAPFVVRGGQADIDTAQSATLNNGGFEDAQGDKMTGWTFQDNIGTASFADKTVTHGGGQSLRIENVGAADPQAGHGRIMQTVTVSPFRQYHLSFWAKTDNFETPGAVQVIALTPQGRSLAYNDVHIQRTQDWTQYQVVFNSLDNTQVNLYFGVWGGKGGKMWWDDIRLEEVGFLNVLRRAGCPVVVNGGDGTVYAEGRDYEAVKDDKLGVSPYPGQYDTYHAPPPLTLTPASRIKDGQHLRVSFYHSVKFGGDQVTACLSDPKVYALMQQQITRVNELLHPPGFLLSHDEIRAANWDAACQARKMTPGQLLADNARRCVQMAEKANPKAHVFVWSDMFDPAHNAHDSYYLVNGTLADSWKGLPGSVVVVNWNFDGRKKSLPFFAGQGHAQVLAGYYDGTPDSIRTWLDDAKGVSGIKGVMYTTWNGNYADLEAFAQAAWGTKQ